MYIPALFSTSENGCPSGYIPWYVYDYAVFNYNSGARGRVTISWNTPGSTQIVGENILALGSYDGTEIGNGGTVGFTALQNPSIVSYPEFGQGGATPISEIGPVTGSNGIPIVYCLDCTRKYRWTFGSKAGLSAPWPSAATPLSLANFSSPSGSKENVSTYKQTTLNFDYTQTGTVEGYGPLWPSMISPTGNSAAYYIISREDITPRYYGIQNCLTASVTRSISLSGSVTLNVGDVFKSSTSTLSGSCWSVTSSFQSGVFTPNISNVVTSSTFVACINCTDPLSIKYNITDCDTSTNYVATFISAPTLGTIFKSNDLQKCFTIVSQASQSVTTDYSNLSIAETYVDCATCLATSGSLLISSLVVGGGGAGGGYIGGGGGGGQYQSPSNVSMSFTTTYPVVVGAGGIAAGFKGTNGDSSSFNGVISIGGGAGGAFSSGDQSIRDGSSGASGGGGSYNNDGAGGTGTAGNNGGAGSSGGQDSGGGGGASAVGAGGSTTSNGGNGYQWFDGNYYAGGGGGYRRETSLTSNGIGGLGGGGNGGQLSSTGAGTLRVASSGSANTGGGGGGSISGIGSGGNWDGGSGVVKIRYAATSSLATGGDIIISGSYVYHTFTGSGNFTTN